MIGGDDADGNDDDDDSHDDGNDFDVLSQDHTTSERQNGLGGCQPNARISIARFHHHDVKSR